MDNGAPFTGRTVGVIFVNHKPNNTMVTQLQSDIVTNALDEELPPNFVNCLQEENTLFKSQRVCGNVKDNALHTS